MSRLLDPASRTLHARYRQIRILVVEDNAFMRSLFSDVMRAIGFSNVQMAPDGWDALDLIPRFNPDLILTDYRMERMDGLELTRLVRRAPDVPNNQVPIVLVTGSTGKETIRLARDAGVTEILAKPVSPQSIIARVGEALLNPREFIIGSGYTGPCRRRITEREFVGARRRKSDGSFEASNAGKQIASRIRKLWSGNEESGFARAEVDMILVQLGELALRNSDLILLKAQKGMVEALQIGDPEAVDAVMEIGLQAILQLLHLGRDRDSDRRLVADNIIAMCRHVRRAA